VHRATSLDGRALACKLQYPDMQSAVESDLGQLRMILGLFERYDRAVSTKQIHAEIAERLREELDYAREAANIALYRQMLAGEPAIAVPEVLPELSTRRLLTMGWMEGQPMLPFVEANPALRDTIAGNLFRAWYLPFYQYGVIHGDPHLGNYSVRPDGGVNLMDLGCVRIFRPEFVKAVIDLHRAIETEDDALAAAAYKVWGFGDVSGELLQTLNVWARFIYQPLLDDRVRTIGETNNGFYGRETAKAVHMKLRETGGIEVPREFVFMDRAALGLGSVFIHLQAELNWSRAYRELIADFDVDALAARQAQALAAAGIPQSLAASPAPTI
jgi:predicted unusual protein kinase regulating ubiquinone biosynthesis (AarF/ABC1/UbiB family)